MTGYFLASEKQSKVDQHVNTASSKILIEPEPPCSALPDHDTVCPLLKANCAFSLPFPAQAVVLRLHEKINRIKCIIICRR